MRLPRGPPDRSSSTMRTVAIETAFLLASSYTCGLMLLAINSRRRARLYFGALVTFALGAAFLALELREFADMLAHGATPQAQRLSLGLLCAGRLPWRARRHWSRLACRADRAGAIHGISSRTWSGAFSASHSSGTRSTSSGSGCSRPSISREHTHDTPAITSTHRATDRCEGEKEAFPRTCSCTRSACLLAVGLTAASFWVANTSLLWAPGIPLGLAVLAIAQMGVHLVFFLHITTGPDNTNNVLALAFGVLIVRWSSSDRF